ncbi:hypothetical protein J6590_106155, partial [Homalodisca vitripennis]
EWCWESEADGSRYQCLLPRGVATGSSERFPNKILLKSRPPTQTSPGPPCSKAAQRLLCAQPPVTA